MTDALDPSARDLESLRVHQDRLRRLAWALSGNEHDAEDLAQETWVRALERGPRDRGALGAWLGTVARRLARNGRRSRARAREREVRAARPEALPSSAEIAARVEAEARLLQAIESLGEPHRTALRDRYLGGLSASDLAERDGVALEAVRSRLRRARAALRARLDEGAPGGWSTALVPILPAGRVVDGAVTAGGPSTASALGTSISGVAALGGALTMKTLTIAAAGTAALLLGWLALSGALDADPRPGGDAGAAQSRTADVRPDGDAPTGETGDVAQAPAAPGLAPDARGVRVAAKATGARSVRGRVAGRDGVGVDGVDVLVEMRGGLDPKAPVVAAFEVRSDADGAFAIDLAPQETSVAFDVTPTPDPAFRFVTYGPYEMSLGEAPPSLEVRALRLDATVLGRVTAPDGGPAEGVTVMGAGGRATTGPDGRYTMGVSTRYTSQKIDAWGPGLAFASAVVDLEAGDERVVDFALERAHVVEGVVLDADGDAVAGAEVSAWQVSRLDATTDGAGRFRLDSLPHDGEDELLIHVQAGGFRPAERRVPKGDGPGEHELDIRLERGATVTGRVLLPDGSPAVGAEVWAGWGRMAWDNGRAAAGDDGTFTMVGVGAGQTRMGAVLEGYAELDEERDLRDGDEVTLRLQAPRAIRGRAVTTEGAPVAGLGASARHNRMHLHARSRTGEDGRFTLEPLPPSGDIEVQVAGVGWLSATRVVPEENDGEVTIEVRPSGVLMGEVVDAATGAPVPSFTVRIDWPEGPVEGPRLGGVGSTWYDPGRTFEDAEGHWRSDEHDAFEIDARVRVEVSSPGYAPRVVDAVVVQPRTDDAEPHSFALARAIDVEVRVTRGGEPVEGALVEGTASRQRNGAGSRAEARTGAAGIAILPEVAPGTLHLWVTEEGGPTVHAGAREVDSAGRSVLVEMPEATDIEVVVLDARGAPRAGVEVSLVAQDDTPSPGEVLRSTTGEDGRAAFERVTPGYWYASVVVIDPATGNRRSGVGAAIGVGPGRETELTLRPPGRGTLVVALDGAFEVPDGTLAWLRLDPIQGLHSVVRGGEVRFEGVPAGSHTFELGFRIEGLVDHVRVRRALECSGGPAEQSARVTLTEDDRLR